MYYVYLIKSINHPNQTYIGYTTNLKERLATHNSNGSAHTAKYSPWELIAYIGFKDRQSGLEFEKYLKTHSDRAFAAKRFWSIKL